MTIKKDAKNQITNAINFYETRGMKFALINRLNLQPNFFLESKIYRNFFISS